MRDIEIGIDRTTGMRIVEGGVDMRKAKCQK